MTAIWKIVLLVCLAAAVGRVNGAPGWNWWGVRDQASELLETEDFAGLEALAARLKSNGYDIEQQSPELNGFYWGLGVSWNSPQNVWTDRMKVLEKWRAAYPRSMSALLAEVNWYIDYSQHVGPVPPEIGGTLDEPGEMAQEKTCYDKATALLKAPPAGPLDDPSYYIAWLVICKAERSPRPQAQWFFSRGLAVTRQYVPLYYKMTDYLMPIVHSRAEPEKSMKFWANRYPGEQGDLLYAYLMREDATNYPWPDFHKVPNLDYDRAKRGLLARMDNSNPGKWQDEHTLACLALMMGDTLIEKRMFLELEGSFDITQFVGQPLWSEYLRCRERCGAKAAIGGAESAERAGNLADAEGRWMSFTTDPAHYVPLEFFYERQGMKDKLLAMKVKIVGKTAQEMSDLDPGYAPADILGEAASYYSMMGEWDKAQIAAQRFDQLRPENMIGKNILLLCAIQRGDGVQAQRTIAEIVGMQTDKQPYNTAKMVLGGQKDWGDVGGAMKNNNIYLGQGTTAIALYYMARGQNAMALRVINDELPYCQENSGKALLESLAYGALARTLHPKAVVPAAGAPAGT